MKLAWKVEISTDAAKDLKKLDRSVLPRVYSYLKEIALLDEPTVRGKNLTGGLAGFWCYRVGDYRIICDILEDELVVLVIHVDHRRKIYI